MILLHRDGARVVAGNRLTPESAPRIERILSALVNAGLTPAEALRFWLALTAYVSGDALETQSDSAREPVPDEQVVAPAGGVRVTRAADARAAFAAPRDRRRALRGGSCP